MYWHPSPGPRYVILIFLFIKQYIIYNENKSCGSVWNFVGNGLKKKPFVVHDRRVTPPSDGNNWHLTSFASISSLASQTTSTQEPPMATIDSHWNKTYSLKYNLWMYKNYLMSITSVQHGKYTHCIIQPSSVITRTNIAWYCTQRCRKWGRISIRLSTHKMHPIPRPNGRAMACILWIFWSNFRR